MVTKHSPLVSSDMLLGLREATAELGIPAAKELRACGLDPRLMDRSEGYVSVPKVADCLASMAEKYGCPELGIRVGLHRPKTRFGAVTLLVHVAPDVETALTYGHKYIDLWTEATRWELSANGSIARITRSDIYTYSSDITQLHLLGITQYIQLMKALCGKDWHPSAVYFSHRRPKDVGYYIKTYKCPVHFEQNKDAFEFPAKDLSTPIPTSNPSILATVLDHLESLIMEKGGEDVCSRTRTFIRQRMGTRMCNLTGAASYLGLHTKALQRELSAHNLSFQDMLADERHDVAHYYLLHSDLSLKQLSSMLGYSDASAFTRAFKKRCGRSPREWREEHRLALAT